MAIILGIKGGKGLHNSSIALLDTEKDDILFVGEEERFNGAKHTDNFPIGSLTYAMKKFNIHYKDIEYVAIGNNESEIVSGYWGLFHALNQDNKFNEMKESCFNQIFYASLIKEKLKQMFPNANILTVNHHDTHAALAFYCSSFEESAVFTSDGLGEAEAMTFSKGSKTNLQRLHSIAYPNSLGFMYTLFCHILGFSGPNPEGKVMALASFGEPKFLDSFRQVYSSPQPFSFEYNKNFMILAFDGGPPSFKSLDIYKSLFGDSIREHNEKLTKIQYDIAASLQVFFEEMIIKLANDLYNETRLDNICVGGGSFLNSVVNNKILDHTPFKNIYINPASHDGGNALGAALYLKHNVLKKSNKTNFKHPYYGYEITNTVAQNTLFHYELKYTQPKELNKEVAKLLHEGAVIGWAKGRAEIGPRALCNRSILASPTKKETIDYLNKEIKKREWFRPYAPVVMAEHASKYFEFKNNEIDSPYMLKVQSILPEAINKIPAISHVDGTARTQTLTREQNREMYDLLNEYSKLSGLHVLLNTSFNIGGESIINSEQDAIFCFAMAKLDYLVLGDLLVSKNENLDTINEYLSDITLSLYFQGRRKLYIKEFDEFIRDNKEIFSALLKIEDSSIIFREHMETNVWGG
jgi:carbamoyltransferase